MSSKHWTEVFSAFTAAWDSEGWTSVEEDLPIDGPVLVALNTPFKCFRVWFALHTHGKWVSVENPPQSLANVTHWMNLPVGPEAQAE